MRTVTLLRQGKFWSMYFRGFDFDDYVSPTPYSINMNVEDVIKKLRSLPANNDVERWIKS